MAFGDSGQTFYLASRRNEGSLPTGHTPSLSQAILELRRVGFRQVNRLPGFGFPLPFPWEQLGPSAYTPNFPGLPQLLLFPFNPHVGNSPPSDFRDDPDRPFTTADYPRTFPTGITGPSGPGGGGITGPTGPTGPSVPPSSSESTLSEFSSSSSLFSSSSPSEAPTGGEEIEQMSVLGLAGVPWGAIGRWSWRDSGDPFPGGGV